MKRTLIKEPVYSMNFTLVTECTAEEFHRYVAKRHGQTFEETDYEVHGLFVVAQDDEHEYLYLWLKPKLKRKQLYSTIAHELIHYAAHLFRAVGATFDKSSEELFAHFHTWAMERVMDKIES